MRVFLLRVFESWTICTEIALEVVLDVSDQSLLHLN